MILFFLTNTLSLLSILISIFKTNKPRWRRLLRLSILLILLQAVTWSNAQRFDERNFILYTTGDGLSDNRTLSLLQHEFGYLWVGTQKGLNRFDGDRFLQFYSDNNPSSLPADYIRSLKAFANQQLGVSTSGGLNIVNPRTLLGHNIIIPPGPVNERYIENSIYGTGSDSAGNVFLLTATGFYQFDRKDTLVFRYDYFKEEKSKKNDIPFGRSNGIISPVPGVLLVATTGGPYIYYISKKDFHPIGEQDDELYRQIATPGGLVHFMHCDSISFSVIKEGAKEIAWFDLKQRKKIVIETGLPKVEEQFNWRSKIISINDSIAILTSSQRGFYVLQYDRQMNKFRLQPQKCLSNYLCNAIILDKDKRLWIGTDRGLLHEKKNGGKIEKIALTNSQGTMGMNYNVRMLTLAGDKFFAGTGGEGVLVFDRKSMQLLKRVDFSKFRLSANNILSIATVNEDSIYVATDGPLMSVNVHNYGHKMVALPNWDIDHDWISWQLLGSDKTLYITLNKNNRFYYRKQGEKSFTLADYSHDSLFNILAPMYMTEDPQGNIWFAGHGASRFNRDKKKFDLLIDKFPKIKISRKEVNGIAFDQNGKQYFGLFENGLAIYDRAQRKFEHITKRDGLPDNNVRAIFLLNNKVWLGTDRGLANFETDTRRVNSFGNTDDMPEEAFTAFSFLYDSVHRQLYTGFNNAILRFNPDSLIKNSSPPEIFIENIQVAGNKTIYYPSDKIEIPYKHNNLVVNLASVNFDDANQQEFAYRLVKDSYEPWRETGTQRSIVFNNLRPGRYLLQVKTFIKNDSWPDQVRDITIIVHPPFWQEIWFIILCSLLLIALIWFLVSKRIKTVKQNANINTQLAELEMKGLHAQMNPHFIFNSLNSIKEMILEDEKQNASRYLSKFAQLIRTSLEHSKQTFITVRQCVDHLHQYLEMEKIRFEEFRYSIHLSDGLQQETILMPPMLIQPLVENAIWHGLQPNQGDKILDVRFFTQGRKLICEIDDNGIGIDKSREMKMELRPTHHSLGIENVKERLRVLNEKYKMSCSLTIVDKQQLAGSKDSGTLARLELSIINETV